MSKIKNDGLDQYGAEPFKQAQQQFGTAGVEGVKRSIRGITACADNKDTRFWFILRSLHMYGVF